MSLIGQKKGEQTVYYPQVDGVTPTVVAPKEETLMEYDDLVKKLRNRRVCVQSGGDLEKDFPLMREAADVIECLQKSRMDLSNLCLNLQETIHGLESDAERNERRDGF